MDRMLSNTFGYSELKNMNSHQSEQLLEATKNILKASQKIWGMWQEPT